MKLEFRERAVRLDPPEARLPGRYKGKRKRREGAVFASCACGARSKRAMSPKRAEGWLQTHLAAEHGGG
jgi:hypothetical protein